MKRKYEAAVFRRFLIGWIGIHGLCTLVFFAFHSLCFVGGVTLLMANPNDWATRVTWDMYATLAPTFAIMPTLVLLSVLQTLVSRRTIAVLPHTWLRVTTPVYVIAYGVLFAGLFQTVSNNALQGLHTDLTPLFLPLYIMFALMAVTQALCLRGYGGRSAALWAGGALLPLLILIPFNNDVYIDLGRFIFNFYPLLMVYPLLLSWVTAALCYRYWRQSDPRKRYSL